MSSSAFAFPGCTVPVSFCAPSTAAAPVRMPAPFLCGNGGGAAVFSPRFSVALSSAASSASLPSLSLRALRGSAGSFLLRQHAQPFYVLFFCVAMSAVGVSVEKRTKLGKSLSAPLVTMALSLCLSNARVVPFSSEVYTLINKILVPLSIPLLLFDSDLKKILRDTGKVFAAFAIGSCATVAATIAAFLLLPLAALGQDSWKVRVHSLPVVP